MPAPLATSQQSASVAVDSQQRSASKSPPILGRRSLSAHSKPSNAEPGMQPGSGGGPPPHLEGGPTIRPTTSASRDDARAKPERGDGQEPSHGRCDRSGPGDEKRSSRRHAAVDDRSRRKTHRHSSRHKHHRKGSQEAARGRQSSRRTRSGRSPARDPPRIKLVEVSKVDRGHSDRQARRSRSRRGGSGAPGRPQSQRQSSKARDSLRSRGREGKRAELRAGVKRAVLVRGKKATLVKATSIKRAELKASTGKKAELRAPRRSTDGDEAHRGSSPRRGDCRASRRKRGSAGRDNFASTMLRQVQEQIRSNALPARARRKRSPSAGKRNHKDGKVVSDRAVRSTRGVGRSSSCMKVSSRHREVRRGDPREDGSSHGFSRRDAQRVHLQRDDRRHRDKPSSRKRSNSVAIGGIDASHGRRSKRSKQDATLEEEIEEVDRVIRGSLVGARPTRSHSRSRVLAVSASHHSCSAARDGEDGENRICGEGGRSGKHSSGSDIGSRSGSQSSSGRSPSPEHDDEMKSGCLAGVSPDRGGGACVRSAVSPGASKSTLSAIVAPAARPKSLGTPPSSGAPGGNVDTKRSRQRGVDDNDSHIPSRKSSTHSSDAQEELRRREGQQLAATHVAYAEQYDAAHQAAAYAHAAYTAYGGHQAPGLSHQHSQGPGALPQAKLSSSSSSSLASSSSDRNSDSEGSEVSAERFPSSTSAHAQLPVSATELGTTESAKDVGVAAAVAGDRAALAAATSAAATSPVHEANSAIAEGDPAPSAVETAVPRAQDPTASVSIVAAKSASSSSSSSSSSLSPAVRRRRRRRRRHRSRGSNSSTCADGDAKVDGIPGAPGAAESGLPTWPPLQAGATWPPSSGGVASSYMQQQWGAPDANGVHVPRRPDFATKTPPGMPSGISGPPPWAGGMGGPPPWAGGMWGPGIPMGHAPPRGSYGAGWGAAMPVGSAWGPPSGGGSPMQWPQISHGMGQDPLPPPTPPPVDTVTSK